MHLLATLSLVAAVVLAAEGAAFTGTEKINKYEDMFGSNMTTPEIITYFGYPVEIHSVTTEDGYILEMHRIPHGKNNEGEPKRVIYLQHCLLCSSADYVMNSGDKALAFQLADAGYDVWMGNYRGNTYSKKHVSIKPTAKAFWKFSFHEMGVYDIPASIDYVLEHTGEETIYYLGFSMGTTGFFVMMSERPEYNDKLKVAALLAPITYGTHIRGPLHDFSPYAEQADSLLSIFTSGEILSSTEFVHHLVNNYCKEEDTTAPLCYKLLSVIAGPSQGEVNKEFLPVILSHTPAGTSVHTINHYAQLIQSPHFQKYDYGRIGNMAHYGQRTPPLYDLSNATLPIGFYWASNDWLSSPVDVKRLADELPNVVEFHHVEKTEFSHLDFAWGNNASELVYKYVLEFLSKY